MSTTIPTCSSRSTGAYECIVQLPEVHPWAVWPTKRSPRAQNPDAKSWGTRDNAVRLRHVEPARVPLQHAAQSPPQLPDSLHLLAKEQSHRPPDIVSGRAHEDGKWEHRVRRLGAGGGSCSRDLWRAWRTRDCRSTWCSENWWGARAALGVRKKSGWGVSWTTSELSVSTPTSGRLQPRTRGNGARRRKRGRNVSCRNGPLQIKLGLDYGMQ